MPAPGPLRTALFAPGDAPDKMAKAVAAGADAVLAASVFHFGRLAIGDVKEELDAAGYRVRWPAASIATRHR